MSEGPRASHLDAEGRVHMIDVSAKEVVARRAVAEATVRTTPAAAAAIAAGEVPKGDVAALARITGIQAAKRTPELIALCHTIPLEGAAVDVSVDAPAGLVTIRAEVRTSARTGVEMEAVTAVAVAALNVWDMVKGIDPGVAVTGIHLVEKVKG